MHGLLKQARGLLARCCALVAVLLALAPAPSWANDRYAAMVADANSGGILHAEHAEALRHPASLTKMMTLYLVFEAIETGRIKQTDRIRVSEEAASAPPTKLGLQPGATIPLIDAAKSLITRSANDMAVAIAEHLAGSEERFARLMTAKARQLGMSKTTFRNASGLPDDEQVSTARDMLTLALRLQDHFPQHYGLFALKYSQYAGRRYRNHNNLLFRYQGTEGIKTGYTRASGFNLVAAVRRGRRHVIGVVLGGRTASQRDRRMQLLIERGLNKASPVRTRVPTPLLIARATPPRRPAVAARAAEAVPPLPPVLRQAPSMARRPAPPVPRNVVVQRPVPPLAVTVATTPANESSSPQSAQGLRQSFEPSRGPAVPQPMPADGPLRFGTGLVRGARPSSLQEQAANLARGTPAVSQPRQHVAAHPGSAPRYRLQGPKPGAGHAARTAAGAAPGAFEIQIGAFSSAGEANQALSAARTTIGGTLTNRPARAEPVRVASQVLYRARFGAFDAAAAANACNELRRHRFDCFVARAR